MKTTLIIGASSAVGEALAQSALNEGNKVITLSRTPPVTNGTTYYSYDLMDSANRPVDFFDVKGAVEALTKSLAAEYASKIRFNCIAPSLTDTPLAGRLLSSPEKKVANGERHPMKRVGEASDLAEMAAFLLGEKSSWITGQILHVDGGMSTLKTN